MVDYKTYETGQETRTEQMIVRLTPTEKLTFFKEAQKLGISISAFVRLLLNTWDGKKLHRK